MMRLRLEPRESTPAWLNVALPVMAVTATLVLCSGLIAAAGADIIPAYGALFAGAGSADMDIPQHHQSGGLQ